MAKVRVHELAKEFDLSSKDIITRLATMGVEVKNHMSTVETDDIVKLKGTLRIKPENKTEHAIKDSVKPKVAEENLQPTAGTPISVKPQEQAAQPGQTPRPEARPQAPDMNNPQGPRPEGQRPQGGYNQGGAPRPQGPRPEGQRPPQGGYGPRPEGQRPPQGGYGPRPEGQRPPQGGYGPRPEVQRPPQGGYGPRPEGQRPPQGGYGPRPEGQRPPQGGYGPRPEGQRPPQGGYGPRPEGQRPPQGGYGPRPEGQRPQGGFAPQGGYGQRPPQGGYGPRPEGQRPQGGFAPQGGYGPRPDGQRPQGGFAPQGGYGQRPPQGGYGPRPGGAQGPGGPRPGGFQGQRPGGPGGPRGPRPGGLTVPPAPVTTEQQPARPRFDAKKGAPKPTDRRDRKEQEERFQKPGFRPKHNKRQVKEIRDTGPKHVVIPEIITVQDLASLMSRKSSELIMKLMALGVMATINQEIDAETATLIGQELGIEVEVKAEKNEAVIVEIEDAPETMTGRPPVVTVMGHVDHGKTSLLDAIRTTNVIAKEAGGITQHIGAYQVEIKGQKITFLDTPGHEAFTAMRARGAQVTDIVVLVVAADDGVMPQTIEAINHSKAAGVPIIVAVNKIDKENANPDKVKQELTEYGLVAEEWGGDTIMVPVSAKAKQNIESLLEMILLVSEVQEFKANPERKAFGTVVEAELDKGRGPVATVLVQKGTLEVGDILVAGTAFGKVRAMIDDKGRRVKKAGPSTPVEVLGLSEVPGAGDVFNTVDDEKMARVVAGARLNEKKAEEAKRNIKVSLEDLFDKIKEGQVKELNVIIKADVQGSIEALRQSLEKLSTGEVRVNPIHGGVGAITETDVMLAAASNAIIIGFNVRPDSNTKATAEMQGVDIRLYRVIYDAIEEVKAAMSGLLDPDFKENVLGKAEVRATFKVPKAGTIAGCFVIEGKIARNAEVRIIRDGVVVHEGKLESLKRFKDDAKEVNTGYECGISIEKYNDIREADIIEAFVMEEVKREL
jgi:translation initiation factor IF-2